MELLPKTPPPLLYHGSAGTTVKVIRRQGIKSGGRNFVHLSVDREEARHIGARHGKPVVLKVQAKAMASEGFDLF